MHVPGHQLQGGRRVGGAALVGEGDPAAEVDALLALGQVGHIVRLPGEAAGEVGEFQLLRPLGGRVQAEHQGGPGPQVAGHPRIDDAAGGGGLDPVRELEHHAAVGGEHLGLLAQFPDARAIRVGPRRHHGHLASDELFQQLLRAEQVEVEVLLVDPEVLGFGEVAQERRFRADQRGHFLEGQLQLALGQPHLPLVAHQGQVAVVDGHRQGLLVALGGDGFLVREQAGQGGEDKQSHGWLLENKGMTQHAPGAVGFPPGFGLDLVR